MRAKRTSEESVAERTIDVIFSLSVGLPPPMTMMSLSFLLASTNQQSSTKRENRSRLDLVCMKRNREWLNVGIGIHPSPMKSEEEDKKENSQCQHGEECKERTNSFFCAFGDPFHSHASFLMRPRSFTRVMVKLRRHIRDNKERLKHPLLPYRDNSRSRLTIAILPIMANRFNISFSLRFFGHTESEDRRTIRSVKCGTFKWESELQRNCVENFIKMIFTPMMNFAKGLNVVFYSYWHFLSVDFSYSR